MNGPASKREHRLVWLLCGCAALHVLFFSAAFPFFNIVDEHEHFDLVVKYSRGQVPRTFATTSEESAPYLAIFGTPEYFWPLSAFPNGEIPPPYWRQPEAMKDHVLKTEAYWTEKINHESAQTPLYYVIAGAWWRLVNVTGLDSGVLLYSLRFLNVFFVVGLVWAGFVAGRLIFPGDAFVRLGVAAIIAFLPQTTFYSINNDVLSPLSFAAVFIGVIKLLQTDTPSRRLAALTGLALTATYLTKVSNLPLVLVALGAIGFRALTLYRTGKLKAAWRAYGVLLLCAAIPVGGWLAWTKVNFGDFTGTAAKIPLLGWTVKPASQWLHHPIFSPKGFWTFISGLLGTFWQGELRWHGQMMAFTSSTIIYTLLSLVLVGVAVVALRVRRDELSAAQQQVLWMGFWSFVVSIAFLGFLSLVYDFHDCYYPSREHPYFTSGRLMGGALIPFLLLFVDGLQVLLEKVGRAAAKWGVLVVFILLMLGTEIATDWPVFGDAYNWFHL